MTDPRLDALARYLASSGSETPPEAFWKGWDAIAGDLAQQVWSDDADPDLREAFTDLLASADDAGWGVPNSQVEPTDE